MATCGEYELEKTIGWGRRATFFAARIRGAKGPAVLVIRRARMAERATRHAFLRAAAEQQAAVGAGCRRLAPILGFDCDETGFAYYATARYETSIAEFLEAGCKVDGALLREIVTGVLAVLSELHEKSRRAHGNLTPGNILLDSQGRVFLTDLAPSAKDATTADDLFALGTLIYQLVRRTARIGMLNPPLDYSPEWTDSLGDDAEGWREFTNRLLAKSRNTGADALKAAAGNVKSLASLANVAAKAAVATVPITGGDTKPVARRTPPKKRSPLPKIAVALLFLGAAGTGGFFYWRMLHPAPKPPPPRVETPIPPRVQQFLEDLKKPLPGIIATDKDLPALLGRIGREAKNSGELEVVSRLLRNWDPPEEMEAQAAAWRGEPLKWTQLADELSNAAQIQVDGEGAEEKPSIITQLGEALAAHKAAEALKSNWEKITSTAKNLAAAKNPTPDFTPWAVNEIVSAKDLADASARAVEALEKLREVRTFQSEKGARVLWARFENEVAEARKTPGSGLMRGWPDRWKQEAGRFLRPTDEKLKEWTDKLAAAEPLIAEQDPKQQPELRIILRDAKAARDAALESNASLVDDQLAKFKRMKLRIEMAKEKYHDLLNDLKTDAGNAKDTKAGDAALKKFEDASKVAFQQFDRATLKLLKEYQVSIGTADLATQMRNALKKPDAITLDLPPESGWTNVTPPNYDLTAAWYKYSFGEKEIRIPFLLLPNTRYAMAAIETPLKLARLSGVSGTPLRDNAGPKIRNASFFPENDWLWKAPTDLQNPAGLNIRYFPKSDISQGDATDDCPATWLTFKDATSIAAKLGGRLPTPEEWAAALKSRPGSVKRLRARAWTEETDHLQKAQDNAKGESLNSSRPDRGSFSAMTGLSTNNDYTRDSKPAAGATSDNRLWLTSANPDGENWTPNKGFINLIGNAAEWVGVGTNNSSPAIIGGSVVSPPSLPNDKPIPVRDSSYFDVTFRLVVKLGEGGEGVGLKEFKEKAAAIAVPAAPAAQ